MGRKRVQNQGEVETPRKEYVGKSGDGERGPFAGPSREGEIDARNVRRALVVLRAGEGLSDL